MRDNFLNYAQIQIISFLRNLRKTILEIARTRGYTLAVKNDYDKKLLLQTRIKAEIRSGNGGVPNNDSSNIGPATDGEESQSESEEKVDAEATESESEEESVT